MDMYVLYVIEYNKKLREEEERGHSIFGIPRSLVLLGVWYSFTLMFCSEFHVEVGYCKTCFNLLVLYGRIRTAVQLQLRLKHRRHDIVNILHRPYTHTYLLHMNTLNPTSETAQSYTTSQ